MLFTFICYLYHRHRVVGPALREDGIGQNQLPMPQKNRGKAANCRDGGTLASNLAERNANICSTKALARREQDC